jgi:hypothetical protein
MRHEITCSNPFDDNPESENKYKNTDKISIKYFDGYKNNVISISNDRKSINILANPVDEPELYKTILAKLDIQENPTNYTIKSFRVYVYFHKNNLFVNDIYKNIRSMSNVIDQNNKIIFESLKSTRGINTTLTYKKTFLEYLLMSFSVQLFKNTIQLNLSDIHTMLDISDQIKLCKNNIKQIFGLFYRYIINNKYYEKRQQYELKYNTVSGNIPYAKDLIITNKGLKSKFIDSIMLKYNETLNDYDYTTEYVLKGYSDGLYDVLNKRTNKLERVPIALMKLRDTNTYESRNQVCRKITTHDSQQIYHLPYPYSFYGSCSDADEIVDPVGCQDFKYNKFFPCCKRVSDKRLTEILTQGLSKNDLLSGLIDTKSKYDINSGTFYQDTFNRSFLAKLEPEGSYELVRLIDYKHKNNSKDLFVVESSDNTKYTITYDQIHPKYREKRNFIPVLIQELYYGVFKNKLPFVLKEYLIKDRQQQDRQVFSREYFNELLIDQKYFLVHKESVLFVITGTTLIDEFQNVYKIFGSQVPYNFLYGSFYNGFFYIQTVNEKVLRDLNSLILDPAIKFKMSPLVQINRIDMLTTSSLIKIKKNYMFTRDNAVYYFPTDYTDTTIICNGSAFNEINKHLKVDIHKFIKGINNNTCIRLVFNLTDFINAVNVKKLKLIKVNEIENKKLFEYTRDSNPIGKFNFLKSSLM